MLSSNSNNSRWADRRAGGTSRKYLIPPVEWNCAQSYLNQLHPYLTEDPSSLSHNWPCQPLIAGCSWNTLMTFRCPFWEQSWYTVGTKLVRSWTSWYRVGTQLVRSQCELVQSWYTVSTKLEKVSAKLVPSLDPIGINVAPICYQLGTK